jgi:hypothetical protein
MKMQSKSSKGADVYVNPMLIFAALLSDTGQPFISKAPGLALGKKRKRVGFVFHIYTSQIFICAQTSLAISYQTFTRLIRFL